MFKITSEEKQMILKRRKVKADSIDEIRSNCKKLAEKIEALKEWEYLMDIEMMVEDSDLKLTKELDISTQYVLDLISKAMAICEAIRRGKEKIYFNKTKLVIPASPIGEY